MEMLEIRHKSAPLSETIDVSEIVGSKVLAKNGRRIGRVRAVHIHPTKLTVEGIWVGNEYIGSDYVDSLTDEGVVLSITPLDKMIGLKVYNSNGKKVGKVVEIERSKKTNNFKSIAVSCGLLKDPMMVDRDFVKDIGHNIILNKPMEC